MLRRYVLKKYRREGIFMVTIYYPGGPTDYQSVEIIGEFG